MEFIDVASAVLAGIINNYTTDNVIDDKGLCQNNLTVNYTRFDEENRRIKLYIENGNITDAKMYSIHSLEFPKTEDDIEAETDYDFIGEYKHAKDELINHFYGYVECNYIDSDGNVDKCFNLEHGYLGGMSNDNIIVEITNDGDNSYTVCYK